MSNNEKKESSSIWKGKGAAITLAVCFVGGIALVGAFTIRNYQNRTQQIAENNENKNTSENSKAVTGEDIVLPEVQKDTSDGQKEEKSEAGTTNAASQENAQMQTPAAAGNQAAQVWFDDTSTLEWPASGAVIISYSMDKTVYFSTLDQYKYNPALIIGGEVGEYIGASAPGIVTNVKQNAQTGLTVTLDMGNGYSAIYGQLKEVPVEIGDYVNTGDAIGYMSEPTKYYSVEGPNLYFEIQKDGAPINPLDFVDNGE